MIMRILTLISPTNLLAESYVSSLQILEMLMSKLIEMWRLNPKKSFCVEHLASLSAYNAITLP